MQLEWQTVETLIILQSYLKEQSELGLDFLLHGKAMFAINKKI